MPTKFNKQAGAGTGTCAQQVPLHVLQRRQTQENTLTEKSAITETLMLYKRRSNFALQTEHQPEHLLRVKHRFQRNRNISKYLDEF